MPRILVTRDDNALYLPISVHVTGPISEHEARRLLDELSTVLNRAHDDAGAFDRMASVILRDDVLEYARTEYATEVDRYDFLICKAREEWLRVMAKVIDAGPWVVKLQQSGSESWICDVDESDPGRVCKLENAERFETYADAADALTAARKWRPFANATIDKVPA